MSLVSPQRCRQPTADSRVQHSQFRRQTVPYTWASHCKVPGADGSTSPWNVQGSGVGGQQRTSTSHGRHKDAVVGEVGRVFFISEWTSAEKKWTTASVKLENTDNNMSGKVQD